MPSLPDSVGSQMPSPACPETVSSNQDSVCPPDASFPALVARVPEVRRLRPAGAVPASAPGPALWLSQNENRSPGWGGPVDGARAANRRVAGSVSSQGM